MKRLTLMLTLSAVVCLVAFPTGASAHTLSVGRAKAALERAGSISVDGVPQPTVNVASNCARRSRHVVDCDVLANTTSTPRTECRSRERARFIGRRSRRLGLQVLSQSCTTVP